MATLGRKHINENEMTMTHEVVLNGKSKTLPFAAQSAACRTTVRPRTQTGPTVTWTQTAVTPAMATEWLALANNRNRKRSQITVARYANDMRCNAWITNGSAIVFGVDGSLLDGQHRLAAIEQSGMTIVLMVVHGAATNAQSTIDIGKPRTDGDDLYILGKSHPKERASIVRHIKLLLDGDIRGRLARAEIDAITSRHLVGIEWVTNGAMPQRDLKRAAILAAFAFAYPVAPLQIEAFYAGYKSGVGLSANSPILRLRELATMRLPKFHEIDRDISLKTLRCLHAHINGESLGKLFVTPHALAFFRGHLGLGE